MEPHHRWRHTRGPISRMLLSLRRVGWKARNCALWGDDRGVEISLMYAAPNMIRGMLRDAAQRKHECAMARSLDNFEHARACADDVRNNVCKSKKCTPRQKHAVASCFCKAVFTSDRLQIDSGHCPLCGGPDSAFHRLWTRFCPQVEEARSQACDPELVQEAVQAGPLHPFWTRLAFPHPSLTFHPPADMIYPELLDPQGNVVQDFAILEGVSDVVVDGSCTRPQIRDLARASFAGVFQA
eukprot:4227381-Pyramimonas_sp.AAC.1